MQKRQESPPIFAKEPMKTQSTLGFQSPKEAEQTHMQNAAIQLQEVSG